MCKIFILIEELMTGHLKSNCKIPCSTIFTTVQEGPTSRKNTSSLYHSLYLYFDEDVTTTNVSVDQFIFTEFLNFLGANLGLWPGLGLFQLLEGCFGLLVFYRVYEKMLHCLRKNDK